MVHGRRQDHGTVSLLPHCGIAAPMLGRYVLTPIVYFLRCTLMVQPCTSMVRQDLDAVVCVPQGGTPFPPRQMGGTKLPTTPVNLIPTRRESPS